MHNLEEFSKEGPWRCKVSSTEASAINIRFYQIQQTGENQMIF